MIALSGTIKNPLKMPRRAQHDDRAGRAGADQREGQAT